MSEWFYVRGEQQVGPLTTEALTQLLASGQVTGNDLVWRDGMANWAVAESVPELNAAAAAPSTVALPAPTWTRPVETISATHPTFPDPRASMGYYSGGQMGALPYSKLGVASFIIAIIAVVLELGGVTFAVAAVANKAAAPPAARTARLTPQTRAKAQRTKTPPSAGIIAAGLSIIAGLLLSLVGVILGFTSLSRQSRRVYGILGIIINGGILVLVGGLMLIGALAK